MYSLRLNIAQRISFTLVKSHVKNIRGFKWRGLDLLLLNFALIFITLGLQIAVCTPKIAIMKMVILLIAKIRSLNLRAECHRPEISAKFIFGLEGGAGVGIPQCIGNLFAKELLLLQLHWKLLMCYFKSAKRMRGTLLRPRLFTNGLS
jgi:hypothetical protein